jgi:putative SOS response-associated peptidase YedK
MPLIVPVREYASWLNPDLKKEEINPMLLPHPNDEMDAYTVGKGISKKTSDTNVPEALEKCIYPELWACD